MAVPHFSVSIVARGSGRSAVLSAAYNTRPLVPEVLVNGDRFDIVRRRPDLEEMLQLEQVPDWLKRTD